MKLPQPGEGHPIQEVQRVPSKMNPKRLTPSHIIKEPKVKHKERVLKIAREKQLVTYKGTPIRLSEDFSAKILQDRKDIFRVLKENKTVNQGYSTQQSCLSQLKEREGILQTSKI